MGPIAFRRVVECSSQDPAFPATNLLRNGGPSASPSSTRWQCTAAAAAREGRADVTLQLSRPARISHLDIGTFGCCTIEAQVSRSTGDGKFEVLLSARTVRPPTQSAAAATSAAPRVTMFNEGEFCKHVALHEWDVLKIVCSAPVDRSSPFGIALLKLLSPDDPQTAAASVNVPLRRVGLSASPDELAAVAAMTTPLTVSSTSDSKLALTPTRLSARNHTGIDGSSPLHKLLFPAVAPSEARRDKRVSDVRTALTRISSTSVGGNSALPPSTSRSIDMVLKAVANSGDRTLSADSPQRQGQSGKKSTTFMFDLRQTVAAVLQSSGGTEDAVTDCQVLLELQRARPLNADELLLLRTYVAERVATSAREAASVEAVALDDRRRRSRRGPESPGRPYPTLSPTTAVVGAGAEPPRNGADSLLRSRECKRSSRAADLSTLSDSSGDEGGGGRSVGSNRLFDETHRRNDATTGLAAGRAEEVVCCPLCQGYYPADEIDMHAWSCQSDAEAGEWSRPLNPGGSRTGPYRDGASSTATTAVAGASFGTSHSCAFVECPVCFDTFPEDVVERHAGRCLGVLVVPAEDED